MVVQGYDWAHGEVALMLDEPGDSSTILVREAAKCIWADDVARLRRILTETSFDWTRDDEPLLHEAVARGSTAAVVCLLEHGSDPEQRDGKGRTALHIAALRGSRALCSVLMNWGADHHALTADGLRIHDLWTDASQTCSAELQRA